MTSDQHQPGWQLTDTEAFLRHGEFFVPCRRSQIEVICELVADAGEAPRVLDLGCGDAAVAEAVLRGIAGSRVHGVDGSAEMLSRARERLARFGDRFELEQNALDAARTGPYDAVLSSLAIHHLEHADKRRLFAAVFDVLVPGGVLVVADVVAPRTPAAVALAGRRWDVRVRERALEAGDMEPYAAFGRLQWNSFTDPDPDDYDRPAPLLEQLKWIERAGLVDVDVYWMDAGHAIFGGRRPAS